MTQDYCTTTHCNSVSEPFLAAHSMILALAIAVIYKEVNISYKHKQKVCVDVKN